MSVKYISIAFVFLSFILYINSIICGFVFDDTSAILKNKDVFGESKITDLLWNDYWGTPMSDESSHKSYRPFTVLTFRLNHYVFGAEAWSYHLINVLLNCVISYLVYQFYSFALKYSFKENVKGRSKGKANSKAAIPTSVKDESFIAVVATLLFVVHPIHTEAVTGVVGRAELLSTIFFLLAVLCYKQLTINSFILSMVLTVLAVASKEQGITVIAVCVFIDIILIHKLTLDEFSLLLVEFVLSPKRCKFKYLLLRFFLFILLAIVLMLWRFSIMQGELPYFTAFDNPAAATSSPARQLTLNYLLPVNAWLLINPNNLLCDWTMGTIPLIEEFSDVRNIATVVFWIVFIRMGFSVFFRDPVSKMTSLSVAMATFTFLPASNLFFNVGFVVAERVLFLPSIGFCLLIAVGAWTLKKKFNCDKMMGIALIFVVSTHSIKVITRNMDWKSEFDIFQSGLKVTKANAKIWNNIGHTFESKQEWDKALEYFLQASAVQPNDIGSLQNVARMYERLGNYTSAEIYYREAKDLLPKVVSSQPYTARINPSSLQLFINLAELIKSDRLEEADQLYREVIRMRPTFIDAYINRGEILLKLNKSEEALLNYQKALNLPTANKSDIYFNIGVVYSQQGNITGAVEAYTYAIAHNPNNVKALFNSAVIFEETREPGLLARAKVRIERVLALEPDNLLAMTLLGTVHMDLGQNIDAINAWNKVLAVDETQRTCLFNMALLYSKIAGKIDHCVDALQKLLKHHPNHQKGILLYGDMMLNKKKDLKEAKRAYTHVLQLDPSNVLARHNYCVVMVEEGDLAASEACLIQVYNMAPHLDFIQENLAKVRRQINLNNINEREKKRSEMTNFQKTPTLGKSSEKVPADKTPTEKEEIIYVAQPIKKKQMTATDEAEQIRKSLKQLGSDSIEENLKKTVEAVNKLKKLEEKVIDKAKAKCPEDEDTKKLKQSALKLLDELEAQLD